MPDKFDFAVLRSPNVSKPAPPFARFGTGWSVLHRNLKGADTNATNPYAILDAIKAGTETEVQLAATPDIGTTLELAILWISDKSASTGVTVAPVVRVYGQTPSALDFGGDKGPNIFDALGEGTNSRDPSVVPNKYGIFAPLPQISTGLTEHTMPITNAWIADTTGSRKIGLTTPIYLYLNGVEALLAAVNTTAATVDQTSTSNAMLMGRVISG